MSAQPSPFLKTLGTGQAMLMSMSASRSPSRSATVAAAGSNCSGLPPNSCTASSGSSSPGSTSSQVRSESYVRPATETISEYARAQPRSRAISR